MGIKSGMRTERDLGSDYPIYLNINTRNFLQAAAEDGAYQRLIDRKVSGATSLKPDPITRDLGITLEYFTTEFTYKEIANKHEDLNTNAIRRIIRKTFKELWKSCSEEVKRKYPHEQLIITKRLTAVHIAAQQVLKGENFIDISGLFELKTYQRRQLLQILTEQGYPTQDLTSGRLETHKLIYDVLDDPESSDPQISEALSQLTPHIYSFLRTNERPIVTNVSEILKEAGMPAPRNQIKQIAERLKESGIPIEVLQQERVDKNGKPITQRYYVIASLHLERAIRAIDLMKES